ncbi:DNA helicase Pif1-like protein [Artemisia annua]|uniref:DNA helicase Pif1-like protein n=1 Tax=Artemisia annua TaxID=35608 RepID=A0A2U1QMY0_ARTAN|nr:DNA helicase Pif1-like protein [Artemisia annua]
MRIKRKAVSNKLAVDMAVESVQSSVAHDSVVRSGSVVVSDHGLLLSTGHDDHLDTGAANMAGTSVPVAPVLGEGSSGSCVSAPPDTFLYADGCRVSHAVQHVNPTEFLPVQIPTVDGSVSMFTSANTGQQPFLAASQVPASQGFPVNQRGGHSRSLFHNGPLILDFSCARILPNQEPIEYSYNHGRNGPKTTPSGRRSRARGMRGPTNRSRQYTGVCTVYKVRQGLLELYAIVFPTLCEVSGRSYMLLHAVASGRSHVRNSQAAPTQGPLAPPQRQGAPLDYISFGGCDQTCQHCHALFWPEEKKAGMPVSAPPQYQKCCAGGRVFLNDNNDLVRLFQTARDKLLEADIPDFQIRLFGVVGAQRYDLPAGDTIGAIVYEGGPESATDYDIVIERHSREAENVNKLHPRYMALQFPLLFVYGEEGYHLSLILRNIEDSEIQAEKRMSMKAFYAYQLYDRAGRHSLITRGS